MWEFLELICTHKFVSSLWVRRSGSWVRVRCLNLAGGVDGCFAPPLCRVFAGFCCRVRLLGFCVVRVCCCVASVLLLVSSSFWFVFGLLPFFLVWWFRGVVFVSSFLGDFQPR